MNKYRPTYKEGETITLQKRDILSDAIKKNKTFMYISGHYVYAGQCSVGKKVSLCGITVEKILKCEGF